MTYPPSGDPSTPPPSGPPGSPGGFSSPPGPSEGFSAPPSDPFLPPADPYQQQSAPPFQQPPGPYQQSSPPFGQPSAPPFQQPAVPYQQSSPPYQQSSPPYQQPGPYQQPAVPYQQSSPPYQPQPDPFSPAGDPYQPLIPSPEYPPPQPGPGAVGWQQPGMPPGPAPMPMPQPGPVGPPGMMPQPAPVAPPSGGSSGPLPWILGGIAAVVVLCLIGGAILLIAFDEDDPDPKPTATSTQTGAPSGGSGGSEPAGGGGPVAVSDLCEKIKLTALGEWASKVEPGYSTKSSSDYAEHAWCHLSAESADESVSVSVSASADLYQKLDSAKSSYSSSLSYDKKENKFDADLPGLGDEAYGVYEQRDLGSTLKVGDYEVNVRFGNLVVSCGIDVYTKTALPKEEVKTKALAQTKAVLTLLGK